MVAGYDPVFPMGCSELMFIGTWNIFSLNCDFRTRLRSLITINRKQPSRKALARLQCKDKPRVWGYSLQSISVCCYLPPVMVVFSKQRLLLCVNFALYFSAQVKEPNPGSGNKTQTNGPPDWAWWLRDALKRSHRTMFAFHYLSTPTQVYLVAVPATCSRSNLLVGNQHSLERYALGATSLGSSLALTVLTSFCTKPPPHIGHLAVVKMELQI